jgi:hypothetical protein
MSSTLTRVLRVVLLCCLASSAVPLWAHAAAGTTDAVPCWKRLLNDWYDGTINNRYPIPCYQQAISHLPADLRIYGSARDDILAARTAAIQHHNAPPEKNNPNTSGTASSPSSSPTKSSPTSTPTSTPTPTPTPTSTTTTTTKTVTTHGTTTTTTTVLVVPVETTPTSPKKSGGIGGALDKLNPGNPDSFPLPLLVLGALAILLVIAGAAGMLWQRSHPRDDGAEA